MTGILQAARALPPPLTKEGWGGGPGRYSHYNLEDRGSEDVLAACERLGIAFLPWFPLGTGAALKSSGVKRLAARIEASPAQVLLAWLLAKSPMMLPIPGTASIAHLEENTAAAALKLSAEDLVSLD
jgi:aryl-alcohol dehydrogenase-like predicted oxidoreductase